MNDLDISLWDKRAGLASKILMEQIVFSDLQVTFIEVIGAYHAGDWVAIPHKHPWYEFNYVSHGALYTKIEDKEFLVNARSFYLIPPGVVHMHRNYNHTGDNGFCIRWRLEKIKLPESNMRREIADEVIAGFLNTQATSFDFPADKLFENIENESIYELEAAFIKWLMSIYYFMNPRFIKGTDIGDDNKYKSIITQVLMYLDEYSASNIDVNELADSVGYSYRHLARLFKEKTGATIVEKLNSIRIAKAINLLENTDIAIGVLANVVGFNSETYFSTIFGEYTHFSPSQFRLKHRRNG